MRVVILCSLSLLLVMAEPHIFSLSFNAIGDAQNVNRATAVSQFKGVDFVSQGTGVNSFSLALTDQPTVSWLSQVTNLPDGGFSESGNLSLGNGHDVISFESRVEGVARDLGENSYGSISYAITGGTGAYEGAQGWMVDYFWGYGDSPAFLIGAWGWFCVPDDLNEHQHQQQRHHKQHQQHQLLKESVPRVVNPKQQQGNYNRVEFNVVFNNHPVNGVNMAVAPSQTMLTSVDYLLPIHFSSEIDNDSPLTAQWTSTPVSYPNGTFSNIGEIDLVNAQNVSIASIKFSSNVLGYSEDCGILNYGGITYWIDSGTGLWAGATGVMIDLFAQKRFEESSQIFVRAQFWLPA